MKALLGLGSLQLIVLSLCLALCACSGGNAGSVSTKAKSPASTEAKSPAPAGSVPSTGSVPADSVSEQTKQTVENYKTRWDNQVKAMQGVVAVLERHLKADKTAASIKSVEPADKARFTQEGLETLVGQTFSGRVNEAAFKTDIERIVNKFEQEDKALRPNMGAVLAANPGAVSTQDGNILAGDEMVDTSSLVMGVVNAVVMNAKARGEDPEAAVNYLRTEVLKKIEENPPLMFVWEDDASKARGTSSKAITAQSFYLSCPSWNPFMAQGHSCLRWTNSIPYVFGREFDNFSDKVLVKTVEDAMQDWTRATGGRATFHRADYSEWFRAKLFGKGVVNIERRDGSSNAQVGYGLGFREVRISKEVLDKNDESSKKRQPRHELGHVIGLQHEHQRWDRDTYVEIPSDYECDNDNCGRMDSHSSIGMHLPGLEPRTVIFHYFACRGSLFNLTCGWRQGSFTIWVPVWKYYEQRERTGHGSDNFDFLSIMLYRDLFVKPSILPSLPPASYRIDAAGRARTNYNIEISPQDAATAASLIGW